jgi:hypothetical protein
VSASVPQVNTLVPIILTGILGFTVFLIPSDDIEKRLSTSAHCCSPPVASTRHAVLQAAAAMPTNATMHPAYI